MPDFSHLDKYIASANTEIIRLTANMNQANYQYLTSIFLDLISLIESELVKMDLTREVARTEKLNFVVYYGTSKLKLKMDLALHSNFTNITALDENSHKVYLDMLNYTSIAFKDAVIDQAYIEVMILATINNNDIILMSMLAKNGAKVYNSAYLIQTYDYYVQFPMYEIFTNVLGTIIGKFDTMYIAAPVVAAPFVTADPVTVESSIEEIKSQALIDIEQSTSPKPEFDLSEHYANLRLMSKSAPLPDVAPFFALQTPVQTLTQAPAKQQASPEREQTPIAQVEIDISYCNQYIGNNHENTADINALFLQIFTKVTTEPHQEKIINEIELPIKNLVMLLKNHTIAKNLKNKIFIKILSVDDLTHYHNEEAEHFVNIADTIYAKKDSANKTIRAAILQKNRQGREAFAKHLDEIRKAEAKEQAQAKAETKPKTKKKKNKKATVTVENDDEFTFETEQDVAALQNPYATHVPLPEMSEQQADELFLLLSQADTAVDLDLSQYNFGINHKNHQQQTHLMLAMQRGFGAATVGYILEHTDQALTQLDRNNENILHYAAKALDPKYFALLPILFNKFAKSAVQNKQCSITEINRKRESDGNIFFHILLEHDSEALVLEALNNIFTIPANNIYVLSILLKNNNLESAPIIVDNKAVNWPRVRDLLYLKITECLFNLVMSLEDAELLELFCPSNSTFFSTICEEDSLIQFVRNNDVARVIELVEKRFELRNAIKAKFENVQFKRLTKTNRNVINTLKTKVLQYLGEHELLTLSYNNRLVYGTIMSSAVQLEHDKFLQVEESLNSELFDSIKHQLPINVSLAFNVVAQRINTDNTFDTSDKRLAKYLKEVRARIKLFNSNMNNLLHAGLDFAIFDRQYSLMTFLYEHCGAIIDDRILITTLRLLTPDNLKYAEYLYNNHSVVNSEKDRKKLAPSLYLQATFLQLTANEKVLNWLLDHKFDPTTLFPNKENILQKLLATLNDSNVEIILMQIKTLLAPAEYRKALLSNKNIRSYTCIDYIIAAGVPDGEDKAPALNSLNLLRAFKLLIAHGASLCNLQFPEGRNLLNLAVQLNSLELLEFFLENLSAADIGIAAKELSVRKRNILEIAQERAEIDANFNPTILERLQALVNKIESEKAASISQNLFSAINKAKPSTEIDLDLISLHADSVNESGQTPLMLAIKKGLANNSILQLIQHTNKEYLRYDNEGRNVLYYWAQFFRPKLNFFQQLFSKFDATIIASEMTTLRELNFNPAQDGTFLHAIIHYLDEETAVQALNQMSSIPMAQIFYPCILVHNKQHKTPIALIDDKDKDWPLVRKWLLPLVPQMAFYLSTTYDNNDFPFFAKEGDFFNVYDLEHALFAIKNKNDCLRLIAVLKDRAELRDTVVFFYKANREKATDKEYFDQLHKKLKDYFGLNELMWIPYKDQSLYGCIMDFICEARDPKLDKITTDKIFMEAKPTLPITEHLEWKKVVAHFSKTRNMTLKDSELKACAIELGKYVNTVDLHNETALMKAIKLKNHKLVKFLCEVCRSTIDFSILQCALTHAAAGHFETVEYFFKFYFAAAASGAKEELSFNLFHQAIFKCSSPDKIKWLIDMQFNPCAKDKSDGSNLMQKLLSVINNQNIGSILACADVLMANSKYRQSLLIEPNKNGKTCLDFLAGQALTKAITGEELQDLFGFLILQIDSLQNLRGSGGYGIYHYVLIINDPDLYRTVTQLTDFADDEISSIFNEEINGRTIFSIAKDKTNLHPHIKQSLAEIEVQLAVKTNLKVDRLTMS